MTASPQRVEVADGRRYAVVSDGVRTYEALLTASVEDDLGTPLGTGLSVEVDPPQLRPRVGEGGQLGLAGDAGLTWDDLSVPHVVTLRFQAPGYRPFTAAITIPANPVFPVATPPIALRRLPLRLQGRVTQVNTQAPTAGATIDLASGGPAPHAFLLRTPLALAHAAGTVQGIALTPVALAPACTVLRDALRGETRLKVGHAAGLAAGQVLQLGAPETAPLVLAAAVVPDDPGTSDLIDLALPLAGSVPAGAAVLAYTAAAAGAAAPLQRRAEAGEAVLALGSLPSGRAVRVSDAPQPDEYHAVGALSDATGRWQANGVGYPALLRLQPAAAGFTTPPPTPWQLDFSRAVNLIDFELKP